MKEKIIKAVVLGDVAVGKTSLLVTKKSGFPLEYIPTIFDNHYFEIKINDQIMRIGCWDTGGGEDYPRIRPLSYPQTNLFLILFSISSRNSFNNCETYWLPEVTKFLPSVPIILVGTKTDLRNCDDYKDKSTFVTYEEGLEMKDKINASAYLECSSLLNKGVDDLFDTMAIIGNNDLKSIIPNQLLRDHYNQSQRSEIYEAQRNNYENNNNNNNNNNKCTFETYNPTLFEDHIKINKDGKEYNLDCWDISSGAEDYSRLRPLLYPNTNVFFICFSISSRDSFNKCTWWAKDLTEYCPDVPKILVGTKIDLRDDNDPNKSDFVKYKEGIKMKDKINASTYIECSSLLNKGVNDLFDTISIFSDNRIQSNCNNKNHKENKCIIC